MNIADMFMLSSTLPLVAAQGWLRSYARKIRSKKERGSTMLAHLTRMIAVDSPNGSGLVA